MRFTSHTALRAALLILCLCVFSLLSHAHLYTVPLTAAAAPGNYVGSGSALSGIIAACQTTTSADVPTSGRGALSIRSVDMSTAVVNTVTSGQYYLGGYYNATADAWMWAVGDSAGTTVIFGVGPDSSAVSTALAMNWAAGFPQKAAGTTAIGGLQYMAYDATRKGWINVDGTAALNGVACESEDRIVTVREGFPWWAILLIVLGSVAIIAVVIVVVCCCYCYNKMKDHLEDDEDTTDFGSRSASFSSHSGSSGSFSSHDSSSKVSSSSGSSQDSSDSYSYSDSSPTRSESSFSSGEGSVTHEIAN